MRADEASEILKAVAEKLRPPTWRLRWLRDRLQEGRTMDVVNRADELIGQAQKLLSEEASALDRWSPGGPMRPIPNYFFQADAAAAAVARILEELRSNGFEISGSGGDFAAELRTAEHDR